MHTQTRSSVNNDEESLRTTMAALMREEMEKLREEMRNAVATENNGGMGQRQHDEPKKGLNNVQFSKVTKIEFSKFRGDDVRRWLFKCEQFFKVDNIADDKKMYSLEVLASSEENRDEWEEEQEDKDCQLTYVMNMLGNEEDTTPYISLNALIGRDTFQTIRMIGHIDMMVLPLGGCEMVLEIQWLSTLGDITCNFQELKMRFVYNGKIINLRGTRKSAVQWLQGKQMSKNVNKQAHLSSMVLYVYLESRLNVISATTSNDQSILNVLKLVLEEYANVFAIPKELLPFRSHDHKIPLKECTQPINIRPYRYPLIRKDAIESMVHELLDSMVIRHSQSSFSSPVVKALMNQVFQKFRRKFTLVFFDDILVYNPNMEMHKEHLRMRLQTMRHNKFMVKPSKCVFRTTQVEYLSHIISNKGVATDPSKNAFVWNNEAEEAFLKLKEAMMCAPVLKLPNFNEEFVVEIDASWERIGVVLQQQGHLIACLSITLSRKHQVLATYEKEFLYKRGTENVAVDALSKIQGSPQLLSIVLSSDSSDVQQRIKDSWVTDNEIQALIKKLKARLASAKYHTWHDGLLLKKGKLCVGDDTSLQQDLIEYFHAGTLGGHSWINKHDLMAYHGLLQPLPIPDKVWSSISMDFIKGLPMSKGKSVVIVVVDRLSKYSRFIPLSHPFTAIQVAQAFLVNIYKLHGLPKDITWNQGFLSSHGILEDKNQALLGLEQGQSKTQVNEKVK
nr:hypothetical protein [Tanacetum cinerariifolium]